MAGPYGVGWHTHGWHCRRSVAAPACCGRVIGSARPTAFDSIVSSCSALHRAGARLGEGFITALGRIVLLAASATNLQKSASIYLGTSP